MGNMLHGSARTTPRIRAELQRSKEKTSTLAERYGLSRTTGTKWRARTTTSDAPMGPSQPKSTVLGGPSISVLSCGACLPWAALVDFFVPSPHAATSRFDSCQRNTHKP